MRATVNLAHTNIGPKSPNEIQVWIPVRWMEILYEISRLRGCNISHLLRRVAANPHNIIIPEELTRPHKFSEEMHRFPMRFHGEDKTLLRTRVFMQRHEFGPYLRYLLEYYGPILHELLAERIAPIQKDRVELVEMQKSEILTRGPHIWDVDTYQIWSHRAWNIGGYVSNPERRRIFGRSKRFWTSLEKRFLDRYGERLS